jgi:hypothetical protein
VLKCSYAVESDEIPIVYTAKFREYGICVLDGGPSYLRFTHCPWCGKKLPDSMRKAWFHKLDQLGVDPAKDKIPAEFTDDRWYRKKS